MQKDYLNITAKRMLICLLLITFVFVLTGCAEQKGRCASCGQLEKLYKFEQKNGETVYLCHTCYELKKLFY